MKEFVAIILVLLFIGIVVSSYCLSVDVCSATVGVRYDGRDLNEKTLAADNGR